MKAEYLITVMMTSAFAWVIGATLTMFLRGKVQLRYTLPYVGLSLLVLAVVLSLAAVEAPGRNSVVYFSQTLLGGNVRNLAAAGLGLSLSFGIAVWPWRGEQLRSAGRAKVAKVAWVMSIFLSYLLASLFVLEDKIRPYVASRSVGSPMGSRSGA